MAAIVIGFLKKLNVGLIAVGLALIVGKIAGYSDSAIIGGFATSLFLTLLGVTYLFSIAQANGTLELIAKKIVALAGQRIYLIPILVFVLGFIISAMGPGPIPTHALVAVFGVSLALQMNCDPIFITCMGQVGAMAGCASPLSPTAIIGETLAQEAGIKGITFPMFASTALCFAIFALILYIAFKGFKLRGENPLKLSEIPAFNKEQKMTLLGIIVMAAVVLLKGYNVGMVALLVAVILNLLKVGNEKESLKLMPWGTIIIVCCISVLMNIVIKTGGIDLLVGVLTTLMSEKTAVSIFGIASGVMSWFSSTSGVVMPTMIPTIPSIIDTIGGNPVEMLIAVVVVANCAGLSPASSAGGQALAAYTGQAKLGAKEQNQCFMRLFSISAGGILITAVMGLIGLFGIFC